MPMLAEQEGSDVLRRAVNVPRRTQVTVDEDPPARLRRCMALRSSTTLRQKLQMSAWGLPTVVAREPWQTNASSNVALSPMVDADIELEGCMLQADSCHPAMYCASSAAVIMSK